MLFVIATRLSSNGQVHLDAGRDSVEIDVESLEIVVQWLEIVVESSCSSASSFQNVFCKIYTGTISDSIRVVCIDVSGFSYEYMRNLALHLLHILSLPYSTG